MLECEDVKRLSRKIAILLTGSSTTSSTKCAKEDSSKSNVQEPDAAIIKLANFYNPSAGTTAAYPTEDHISAPRHKLYFVVSLVQTIFSVDFCLLKICTQFDM